MDHQELGMIRHVIIDVEQEPVKSVFEQCPDEIAKDKRQPNFEIRIGRKGEYETKREVRVDFERCQRDAAELKKRAQADVRRYG